MMGRKLNRCIALQMGGGGLLLCNTRSCTILLVRACENDRLGAAATYKPLQHCTFAAKGSIALWNKRLRTNPIIDAGPFFNIETVLVPLVASMQTQPIAIVTLGKQSFSF